MAGGNDERVNLLISAAVDGLKNVEGLIGDLQELEQSGRVELPDNSAALREGLGKTSEEMQGLASRLTELREQQGLVTQFAELKRETKELGEQQQAAKARATELGKALSETENPTRAQTQEFERAKKAASDVGQAWVSNNQELNELRGSLEGAGISTKDLAGEQVRINKEIEGVNQQASTMSDELREVKDSADDVSTGTDKAAKSTKDLGEEAEQSSGLLGKLGGGLKTVAKLTAGVVAGVGASVATLTVFSKKQASVADELTNTSNAIGVNREALQVWQIAAERVGVSGDSLEKTLTSVTERLGKLSATGSGRAGQVFDALNMDIKEFQQLAPDQQLIKLAGAIEKLPKSEQVAVLRTLGSDAEKLMPLLEDNAAGLRAIAEEAEQAGAIYSEEELDKLNKANDVYNAIDLKLKGLTTRIGAKLAPAVAQATDKVLDLFNSSGAGEALVGVFTRLSDSAVGFLEKLSTNSSSIGESFSTLTKTISFFGNSATAVFRAVQATAAYFLTFVATGIAGVMSAVQGLVFALNKVGVVSDSAYNTVAAKAEAARSSVIDLQNQTLEFGRQSAEAGAAAIKAFEDTGTAAKESGDKAEESVGTLTTLADNIKTAGEAAEDALRDQAQATEEARRGLSDYGVDVKEVMTGVTTEAQEAIDGVGKLAGKIEEAGLTSEQSAKAFKTGFSEAIEAVNTKEGLTALQDKIKGLKEAGEIGAEGANTALETIRLKMLELKLPDLGEDETVESIGKAGDAVAGLSDKLKKLKKDKEEAAKEAQEFREALGAAFSKALTNARTAVSNLSTAARNLFEQKIGSNMFVDESISASEALENARQRTDELAASRRRLMSSSLAAWFADTALAAAQVKQEFYAQAVAMENLTDKVNSGSLSLDQLDRMAARATSQFSLLDDQRLSGLQAAIDQARSKIESLNSSAESTLNSLQQRLADISGDTERAQQLQYEAERKRLQQELENARQAGADNAAADYSNALDQLQKINAIEQKNRREAENEREKAAADRARQQEQAERERQQAERQRTQTTTASSAKTESIKTVTINLGGQSVRVLAGDEDNLIRALETARSTAL